MLPVGFERTTPGGERPQTYALDRAATGTGIKYILHILNIFVLDERKFIDGRQRT